MSGITDKMGGIAKSIVYFPDKCKSPGWRKFWRIAFDVGLIALGIFILYSMNKGNLAALANPTVSTLMSMPLTLGLVGLGASWLIQDLIGKEHQRTAALIAAIAMPALLAGAGAALMATGFQHGIIIGTSMNNYFLIGIVILPLSCFAAANAIKMFSQKKGKFIENPNSIPIGELKRRGKAGKFHRRAGDTRTTRLRLEREADRIAHKDTGSGKRKRPGTRSSAD